MFLIIWTVLILIPLTYCRERQEAITPVNFAQLFKGKCEGLPFRSFFSSESMTCYISVDSKEKCSEISVAYGTLKKGISASDSRKLKSIGIIEDEKSQICGFKIQGGCNSGEQVENWCYNIQKKEMNFNDAAEFCENKGESLPVLHSDIDIQRFLHLALKEDLRTFWIGAATVDGEWQNHDSTLVDFFRFSPAKSFRSSVSGMLFQVSSKNDTYSGYEHVSGVDKKYPFICTKRIDDDYHKETNINKFPPHFTTLPPTTKAPKIENPKEWICDSAKGTKIHRSSNRNSGLHHYTLDAAKTPGNFYEETAPGYVVSEERYPRISDTCPELVKVGVWKSGTMSYIGNNPPSTFTRKDESFYCSPRQFYCGANFQLRRLDKNGGGDILYPSSDDEANKLIDGYEINGYQTVWFLEAPCWIWQSHPDTNVSIVKAAGAMLWGAYNKPNIAWIYSLDRYELVDGKYTNYKNTGPGYVMLEDLYEAYFKEKCPELIPLRIWHGSYKSSEYNAWIGRDSQPPPSVISKYVYRENRRFYCAPRKDYCGADHLLKRMESKGGSANLNPKFWYPHSIAVEVNQVQWWKVTEDICYIWSRWVGPTNFD